jgi:type I restriction enzyme S subunit
MKKVWQKRQLGELAELRGRIGWRGLTAKEYTKEGPLFLSVHSLNYGENVSFQDAFHISEERYAESPEIMLQPNDVLICKDGAGIGKVGIVGKLPDRTTINSSLLLIRSGKEILPKFLYRCLSSPYFQEIVQSRLNGATTPHLYQRDITEFPIVLPPLVEQQRIVAVLDEAFAGLATAQANAEKNLQNARELFDSYLDAVFTKRGKGWVKKPLEAVTTILNGYAFKSADFSPNACVKCIKITNVGIREFVAQCDSYLPAGFSKEYSPVAVKSGSIVIALTRTIISGGLKVAVVPDEYDRALLNQRVAAIQTDAAVLGSAFLFAYLSTQAVADYVIQHVNTLMQPNLSIADLRTLPVPVPPREVQYETTTQLDALAAETQRLQKIYEQKLVALVELKKSLLHQAFSGEL